LRIADRVGATGSGTVSGTQIPSGSAESTALAAALRAGDERAFDHIAGRHRRELLIHCYRMLGSLDDAEDAVQDALLRAWRYRESLLEGAPLRPWLYRVATNVCLDAIARDERRSALAAASMEDGDPPSTDAVAWLQPIPDSLIEPISPRDADPETIVLSRETIELAFLTVIQLLTPQQRAALILCDVLGWSAKEAAGLLDVSSAAVNSALQRARATLQRRLPARKPAWPAGEDPSVAERELLKKIVDASEKADLDAFASIIRDDAVFRMPPQPDIVVGRDTILKAWVDGGFGSDRFGRLGCILTRANLQPAVANYVRRPGDTAWQALALDVLRIEDGLITEIVTFAGPVFSRFGLPLTMDERASAAIGAP
jgi:RNA polymerase sigma-70 factor, ECF subfamily